MNIFVLDADPFKSAQYHCNKHVCKMIVESAQILSTVHHVTKSCIPITIYKKTHENHPCSIWARKCIENYQWLALMALELCKEYTFRYNKTHKTENLLMHLATNWPFLPSHYNEKGHCSVSPFAQAMPEKYRIENDAITAYRNYYKYEKKHFAKYTKREVPSWLM
jgi:hypothetical protein